MERCFTYNLSFYLMIKLKGISISKGITIGRAYVIEPFTFNFQIEKINTEKINEEIKILNEAIDKTESEIEEIFKASEHKVSELKLFFISLLRDQNTITKIVNTIINEKISAKSAVLKFLTYTEADLKRLPNFQQEKINDIVSIFYRLTTNIDKIKGIRSEDKNKERREDRISEGYILVGIEIDPTQLLDILQTKNVKGIVLEKGGSASHASIIAHQYNIPAIFAVKDLMRNVKEDDLILLNASDETVVINPDEETLRKLNIERLKFEKYQESLSNILSLPTKTIDAKECKIMLNISDPYEVTSENSLYYDGVGLFRTEFPFLNKGRFLSEEEQVEIYSTVAERFANKPVIIRLLDIGGDKVFEKNYEESKPALGWRSIRILFDKKDELLKQLRAIIKSNIYGNIKILVPMVSSISEVRKIKEYFNQAVKQLEDKGVKVIKNIPIGIMVEIPSVAVMIKEFLKEVDFISIGTNDLTQYVLAVDRNNETIAEYYEPLNPAVLKLVYHCIHTADKEGKFVSVCGEIAGDPKYTRLLLAMGLRNFSMTQSSVPFVKNVIINTHTAELRRLFDTVKNAITPDEVKKTIETDYKEFLLRIRSPVSQL